MKNHFLSVMLLVLTLSQAAHTAFAHTAAVEFSAGTIAVASKDPEEIDKKGKMTLVRVYSSVSYSRLDLSLGLGLQTTEVEGIDRARGVKQYYTLRSPSLDAMAHFRTWNGLYLGIAVRNQIGRGASLGVEDEGRIVYVLSAGPSLFYRWTIGDFGFNLGAVLLRNQSTALRTVTTQAFSVGVSYEMSDSSK